MKNTAKKRWPACIPAILFLVYLAALILITIIRPQYGSFHYFGGQLNLSLFSEYPAILQESLWRFCYLFLGNIVWFIPLGFYCTYFKNIPLHNALWIGFAASLFIEIMQYILGTGISELDDLILNTTGCIIGSFFAWLCLKFKNR